MQYRHAHTQYGFGLVEVLVVLGISVMIFVGLFASIQYSLQLIANSSAKLSALSLANDRIEYFRSLPYDDVGTVSGIPAGTIPQNSTTTLNGITFSERVLVEYVDDVADGALTATTTDSNGIPSDYKRVKIEISWDIHSRTESVSLVSNIVPRSIETTAGGGTVRVNVLDADSTFLTGAEVRLLNETTTSTIDVTRFSDVSGAALFSGAPAASDYQVFVTAPGYSSDQTYIATTSNPNPSTVPFAVLESDISTVTFQIGELSDIELTTMAGITEVAVTESFDDATGIASSTNTEVSSGALVLENVSGSYLSNGQTFLEWVNPASLEQWEVAVITSLVPINTDFTVQFYTGTTSAYSLVSDSDLPGNASGFTDAIIDLSGLDVSSYPDLTMAINFTSSDPISTPQIYDADMYYRSTDALRANVNFDVVGNKTIGAELDLSPIHKVDFSTSTDAGGELIMDDIEFDTYTISNTDGFTVARACPNVPLNHQAGATSTVELVLVSGPTHSLRVSVQTATGDPLPGADVTVSRTGFTDTLTTDSCGQVYFSSGLGDHDDYRIEVTRTGYTTTSADPYDLENESSTTIVLTES